MPPQWWTVFPQYRQRSQQMLRAGASSAQQLLERQQQRVDTAAIPQGATALIHQGASSGMGLPQLVQQHGQEAHDQEHPRQHDLAQRAHALRRVLQPGVRSILKGSQPPAGLGPGWIEPSQQVPGALLANSDPTSARVPRRVQFQLVEHAASGPLGGESPKEGTTRSSGSSEVQQHSCEEALGSAVGDHMNCSIRQQPR